MGRRDIGQSTQRIQSEQKPLRQRKLPELWIEEIAGDHPTRHEVEIVISWDPEFGPNKLKDCEVDIAKLVADFRDGIFIQARTDKQGRHGFDVVSSQFVMRLASVRGRQTGVTTTRFFGCRRNHDLHQSGVVKCQLTFASLKAEVECDLDLLIKEIWQYELEQNLYLSERTKAIAKLQKSPSASTDRLADLLHSRLDSLENLLELLKHRFEEQPHPSFFCTLCETYRTGRQGLMPMDERIDNQRFGLLTESIAAKLDFGTLKNGCVVEIRGADANEGAWSRGKMESTTARTLEIKLFKPGSFSSGQRVEIRRLVQFDRKNHLTALRSLLGEKTRGHWPALVRLMVAPKELPLPASTPPDHWFNDKLNGEQRLAVTGAINAPFAFFIQGPPGTGKSTVISEIVQHLVARGERVLLVAPTHVAVDAVLEKIGDAPNIFAVRLAREEEDISPDCRRFHDSLVHETLAKAVRCRENSREAGWNKRLGESHKEEERLLDLQHAIEDRLGVIQEQQKRTDQLAQMAITLEEIKKRELSLSGELAERTGAMERAQETRRREEAGTWCGRNILADWGWNDLGRARRAYDQSAEARKATEKAFMAAQTECSEAEQALNIAEKELHTWIDAGNRRKEQLALKIDSLTRALKQAAAVTGEDNLGDDFTSNGIAERLLRLRNQQQALKKWLDLEQEWLEATSTASPKETGRQLLRAANLICATTVASGSHPRIKGTTGEDGEWNNGEWGEFDTLIVDEASRVTDAEFLIGAVRSRRWILVGDEHQLPPYVEQDEEHFLHALAALRMAEQGDAPEVTTAVEKLESWWEEDEELRQFRQESVLTQVAALLDLTPPDEPNGLRKLIETVRKENQYEAGIWATQYRGLIGNIAASMEISKETDRHRRLMQLMIQFMVHSLFERCLAELGSERQLCQKLVVQRRMLGSLAELVRGPIYDGNYTSPEAGDLRDHGLIPFGFSPPFNADVVFLDTSAQVSPFHRNLGSGFVNDLESDWILKACRRFDEELFGRDVREPVTVTILCFYKAQVDEVCKRVQAEHKKKPFKVLNLFEQNTVRAMPIDRIQGQESDIVFISFVRTCKGIPRNGFGAWLQDYRRLNVACTRAHQMLVLTGHRRTLEVMGKNSVLGKARQFYENLFDRLDGHQVDAGNRYHIVKHL